MIKFSSMNILTLLIFFSSTLFSIITPMAKELSIALTLDSEKDVSTINSIFLMVAAISSIFWALSGDKISRKVLLIIATFEWSTMALLTIFAFNFNTLLMFQILTAIGFGAALPLVYSLTVDFIEPEKRGKNFGLLSAVYVLGNGFGQVLSGFLIDMYLWQAPLIIVSIGGYICTSLLFLVHEPYRGKSDKLFQQSVNVQEIMYYKIHLKDINKIGKIKSTVWILILNFVMFIAIGSISSFFISMLKNDYSLSSTLATIFLIIVFGSQIPSGPIFGKIGDNIRKKDVNGRIKVVVGCLSFGSILYIIGFSLFLLSNSFILALIFLIFAFSAAFLFGGIDPLIQATLGEVNPPQIRSTIYSINFLAYSFGRSISLILLGEFFLIFNNNYSPGYIILSILALSSSLFIIPIFKNVPKDIERIKLGVL